MSSLAMPSRTMPQIAFIDLKAQYSHLKADIDARIQAVLDHGQYIMGPEVGDLERQLAAFAGVRHAIAVANGTDALLAALMAWGVGPGDAVFLPGLTFTATAEAPLLLGASPVFVDVDPERFTLDPADLERRIADVRRGGRLCPKVIVPVDLYGLPADYARIAAVADGIPILADAAQSFGATANGRRVGTLGAVTATSFFPAKPLGCYGDGGALFTDDDDLAAILRSLRVHGAGAHKYDVVRVGMNSRLDTIQAAVLLAKLPAFPAELEQRERVARRYDAGLDGVVHIPQRPADHTSTWAQYTIRHEARDLLASALGRAGVPTAIHYPKPMHLQPAYIAYGGGPGSLPVSEALCEQILSLPMHPYMDDATADHIVTAVRDAVAGL